MRRFRRKANALTATEAPVVGGAKGATSAKPVATVKATTKGASTTTRSPLEETIAGGIARAGSQSTIHPLDTVKVRMQAKDLAPVSTSAASTSASASGSTSASRVGVKLRARKVASLYRGVFGAASGAGIAIGAYFALYSWAKKVIHKVDPNRSSGAVAFQAGALAGAGSCVVKVPIAVCIRSVQAKLFPNVFVAAKSITKRAGVRGLFTGFLPTVFEDVPDMAVKFAVYESLKTFHGKCFDRRTNTEEDLLIGGIAGAVSAAATTPWDVVKTRMMCSASTKPSVRGAIRGVMKETNPVKGFFTGVGPRSISSGIHTAIFFCFFEAICNKMARDKQQQQQQLALAGGSSTNARAPRWRKAGGSRGNE